MNKVNKKIENLKRRLEVAISRPPSKENYLKQKFETPEKTFNYKWDRQNDPKATIYNHSPNYQIKQENQSWQNKTVRINKEQQNPYQIKQEWGQAMWDSQTSSRPAKNDYRMTQTRPQQFDQRLTREDPRSSMNSRQMDNSWSSSSSGNLSQRFDFTCPFHNHHSFRNRRNSVCPDDPACTCGN